MYQIIYNTKIKTAPSVDKGRILIHILLANWIFKGLKTDSLMHCVHLPVADV